MIPIKSSKRSKSYIPSTTTSIYEYHIQKQLWDLHNNKSECANKTQSTFQQEYSLSYRGYTSLNPAKDIFEGSMNSSLLAPDTADDKYQQFFSDSIQGLEVQQQFILINKLQDEIQNINKQTEFYLNDTLGLVKEYLSQKLTMPTRRQKSLDDCDFIELVSLSPISQSQTLLKLQESEQLIDKVLTTSVQTQCNNLDFQLAQPIESYREITLDGNRFSFCQPLSNKLTHSKTTENNHNHFVSPPEEIKYFLEKIRILEKKILVLENKLIIYDSAFHTQDSEIQALVEEVKKFQIKEKEMADFHYKKEGIIQQQGEIKNYFHSKRHNTAKEPEKITSPKRTTQIVKGQSSSKNDKQKETQEYLHNQNDRIDMLQKQNRHLSEELLKQNQLNTQQTSQLDELKDYCQTHKSTQEKLLSDPLYSTYNDQFCLINQERRILDQQYLENETINQLYKQISQQKIKFINLELECDRQKSINNFLHKTINEKEIY